MKTYTKRCVSLFLTVVMLISCMLTATTNVYAETPGDVGVILDDDAEIQYRSRSKIYTTSREELSEPWILYDTKYGTEHLGMRTTHTALHNADEMDAMYSRCIHKQEIVNKYISGYTNQYFYATVAEFNAMDKGAGYSPDGRTYYRYTYCTTINHYADYYYYMWSDWTDWGSTPVTPDDDTEVETRKIYTINYDANGGSGAPKSQIKISDEDLILSDTIPLRDDYVFLGWSTSLTGEAEYSAGAVYSANAKATLYAVWKHKSEFETIKTYYRYRRKTHTTSTKKLDYPWILYDSKIEYKHTNFASVIKTSGYYGAGTLCIHEEIPIQRYVNDYDPLDWFYATHDEFSELIKKDPSMVFKYGADLEDYTKYIYCTSTEPYEIYYYYSWGEWSDWSEWKEFPENANDSFQVQTKPVALFTISYDANGGIEAPNAQTKVSAISLTISDAIPVREGCVFLGWSSSPDGKVEYTSGAKYSANMDATLYAVWHTHIYDSACDTSCNDCGEIRETTPHTYGNWIFVDPNSCLEGTYKYKVCSACGDIISEDIPAIGEHNYVASITLPTCIEQGYTTHVCNSCGDSYVDSYVKANGHNYISIATAPTCVAQGYTTHKCDSCDDSYVDSYISAKGHEYNDDCDTTCNNCDYVREITHSYGNWIVTNVPTCVGEGSRYKECSVCCDKFVESISATGEHDYIALITKPTCISQGYTTHTCSVCGDSYVDSYLQAKGHRYDGDCDTNCNVCDDERVITHTYGSWMNVDVDTHKRVCQCGHAESAAHNWDEGVIITKPTETTFGVKTYTCKDCSTTKTEELEKVSLITSGTCGRNLTWSLYSDGELVIEGTGNMYDYRYYNNKCTSPWNSWKSDIKSVVIKDGVTSIGDYAFYWYHDNLAKVEIAGTVIVIGEYAFYRCYSLTDVIFAEGVTEIGKSAFEQCSFTKVTIPNSITKIDVSAFSRCSKLKDLSLGKGIKFIESSAFSLCPIENVWYVGNSDDYAEIINRPSGSWHLNNCLGVYEEKTHIYSDWINHNDTQHKIICECGDVIFADHSWNDGVVTKVPTHLTTGIMIYTCSVCNAEKTVDIVVQKHEFTEWTTFSDTQHSRICECGTVETESHDWDNGVVTIEPTHTSYGECTYVCKICSETKVEQISKNTEHIYSSWVNSNSETHQRTCVCGDVETENHNWDDGSVTVQATHTTYGERTYLCVDCSATKTEQLPKITAHSYGSWIKENAEIHKRTCVCGNIETEAHNLGSAIVTKQPTHTTYGECTYTCSDCAAIIIEQIAKTTEHSYDSWTKVDDETHKRTCVCGDVETYVHNWNDGIITIQPTIDIHGEKTYTCHDCLAIKTEQLSKILPIASGTCGDKLSWMLYESGLLRISGTGLMYNNTITTSFWYEYKSQIKTVEITEGASSIGDYAFYYCTNLTQINLPDSIVAIGNGAFYDCRALKSIVIPSGVDSIGNFVFRSCIALTNISIPDSVTSIGEYAFYYCTRLSNIVLPSNISYIGEYSFGECRFKSITLPDSVTSIGKCAFYKCTNLSCIAFTSSVKDIGSYAFDSCNNLNTVVYCGNKTQWDAMNFGNGNSTLINATREYHIWQDATCTAAKRCLLCNIEEGDPLHNWDDGTITVQATHTSYGERTYTCKDCSATKIEQIAKTTNHTYTVWLGVDDEAHKRTCVCGDIETESHSWSDWQIIQDSSCVDFGSKYKVCGVCGYTITKSIEPTGVHSYNGVVKKPTCTYQGYTTYTCGVCGDSYIVDYVDIVAHIPGDWEQSVAPKCEDEGEDIKKCTVCKTIVDTRIVDATGHDFDNWHVSIAAKFHVDGQERRDCKNCDHFETKRIPKFSESHICDYTGREEIVENPTCTGDGSKRIYCTEIECGKYVIVVLDATGHTEGNWEIKTQPTCTEYGTEVKRCTVCKTKLLSRPIDPTGHKYDNDCDAICNVCESVREVPDHIYDNTCDTSCNECGAVRTITHTYSNNCDADCDICGFIRTPSDHVYDNICDTSCNECGDVREITHTYSNNCDTSCNVCGFLRDVPDHLYDKTVVQPTCTSQGYTVYTCYVCGYEYKGDYVNALGHSYSDDFDATCNNCDFVRDAKKHGDTNNDGEINNKDCALLIQYTNGWNVQIDVTAADVNADGKINNKDYVLLMRYINGWDVELK